VHLLLSDLVWISLVLYSAEVFGVEAATQDGLQRIENSNQAEMSGA
jgi:hypothetical protein